MTSHPNRGRYSDDQIRTYLLSKPEAERVLSGSEAASIELDGRADYDDDEWHVYGRMPNTVHVGWYFAGYTSDVVRDMRAEGI